MAAGQSAKEATQQALKDMTKRLNNTAGAKFCVTLNLLLTSLVHIVLGAITLSNQGDVGIYHTSRRMAWAYQRGNEVHYGIGNDQHDVEIL